MTDTLPDVILLEEEYQDLYAATGITVGKALLIQNKTMSNLFLQEGLTQPDPDDRSGILVDVNPNYLWSITSGSSGVWAFGAGPIHIQEA